MKVLRKAENIISSGRLKEKGMNGAGKEIQMRSQNQEEKERRETIALDESRSSSRHKKKKVQTNSEYRFDDETP